MEALKMATTQRFPLAKLQKPPRYVTASILCSFGGFIFGFAFPTSIRIAPMC